MYHHYLLVLYSENIQSQWVFTYSSPSVSTLVFHLYRNVSSKHGSSREGPANHPILINICYSNDVLAQRQAGTGKQRGLMEQRFTLSQKQH